MNSSCRSLLETPEFKAFTLFYIYTLIKGVWLPLLNGTAFSAADLLSFIVLPAALIVGVPDRALIVRRAWNRIGDPGCWVLALMLVFAVLVIFLITFLLGLLIARNVPLSPIHLLSYSSHPLTASPLLDSGYYAICASVAESVFFLALLGKIWQEQRGRLAWGFSLMSAAMFATVHWHFGFEYVMASFFEGLLFAECYRRTGVLWVPALANFIFDFLWIYLQWG